MGKENIFSDHWRRDEAARVYPNFERELAAFLARWRGNEPTRLGKINLKTRPDASADPLLSTADILTFLYKWYEPAISQQSDPAREAYKGAKRKLKIMGQERPQKRTHFYTLEEVESILREIYQNWSRIKAVEGK